jgi:hypothetical protein
MKAKESFPKSFAKSVIFTLAKRTSADLRVRLGFTKGVGVGVSRG